MTDASRAPSRIPVGYKLIRFRKFRGYGSGFRGLGLGLGVKDLGYGVRV